LHRQGYSSYLRCVTLSDYPASSALLQVASEVSEVTDSVASVTSLAQHCHGSDFALTPPPATPVMFNTWCLSTGQVQSSSITLILSRQFRSPRSPHHHCCASGYHSSHCTHLYHSLCRCTIPFPSSYSFHPSSFTLSYV
jgi:hypothetical protein